MSEYKLIKPEDIFNNDEINTYIKAGNTGLGVLGYTEHGFAHAKKAAACASDILDSLGYPRRLCELAAIAGYMHDIGNVINRDDHAHSGAIMAFQILNKLSMPPEEISQICAAIGHHDERTAYTVNPLAAALILSDKTDVRRSRVRKNAAIDIDIHDRVNYAVQHGSLDIDTMNMLCRFSITIDTEICPVMDYFEIFLDRMVLCRKAAAYLGLQFKLLVNDTKLL